MKLFILDSIPINSPNLSHNFLHKYKPNPVDLLLFNRPAFPVKPFSNTLSISSEGIPIPLSSIINSIPFFEERTLYKMIEQRGLLISECPKEKKLTESVADARNRIIAALSNELAIMEMKEYSDKLSTLNYALELGRNIKVLEFPDENNSVINNRLIKKGVEKL